MEKFQNKYRIDSARLQHWDYGWDAAYFITICTKDRQSFFGDVVDGEMKLSNVGVIADICWYEIKNHAKNIELADYIVMPNHVHGILILSENNKLENKSDNPADVGTMQSTVVETTHALSLPQPQNLQCPDLPRKTIGQQRFQNQGQNTISSIVGGYKSAVTKHAHRLGFDFAWQSRFYDHIIRDEQSFSRISEYIENNPYNWKEDKFFI